METFREIKGYEGIYEVSNIGNVRSSHFGKIKLLKSGINSKGYRQVVLCLNDVRINRKVHQLVAVAFKNHSPCGYKLVVNHINFNKLDNRVENLEIVTQRENADRKHRKSSSKYVGVCRHKASGKWVASIKINGQSKYLGIFINEIDAHKAYQDKLKEI